MAGNPNYDDVLTTTIENRSRSLADNVTNNNALLAVLNERGKVQTFSGGSKIIEEMSFAENPNYKRYSGFEVLPTAQGQTMTAAEYLIRQVAVAVPISGLEELQNAGQEQMIDMVAGRVEIAEATMTNGLSGDVYSDGTADGGKQIDGLQAAVADAPTSGIYGGIDRASNTFWQNNTGTAALTTANIQAEFNAMYLAQARGRDTPDTIVCDNQIYSTFWGSLQAQQRFSDPALADLGFETLRFANKADVIYDGGYQGSIPDKHAYFLNTDYIKWRPHSRRNMVPLNPDRYSVNQDAVVKLIGFAGNLATRNAFLQGVFVDTT